MYKTRQSIRFIRRSLDEKNKCNNVVIVNIQYHHIQPSGGCRSSVRMEILDARIKYRLHIILKYRTSNLYFEEQQRTHVLFYLWYIYYIIYKHESRLIIQQTTYKLLHRYSYFAFYTYVNWKSGGSFKYTYLFKLLIL